MVSQQTTTPNESLAKGKTLRVSLHQGGGGRIPRPTDLVVGNLQRRKGKVAAGDNSARVRHLANKSVAAASDLQKAQARDVSQLFAYQLAPRRGCIIVVGTSIVISLMPAVVCGAKVHVAHLTMSCWAVGIGVW
jgi:hypothetical protein